MPRVIEIERYFAVTGLKRLAVHQGQHFMSGFVQALTHRLPDKTRCAGNNDHGACSTALRRAAYSSQFRNASTVLRTSVIPSRQFQDSAETTRPSAMSTSNPNSSTPAACVSVTVVENRGLISNGNGVPFASRRS